MSSWEPPRSSAAFDLQAASKAMNSQGLRRSSMMVSPHTYEELTWDFLKPLSQAEKEFFWQHDSWTQDLRKRRKRYVKQRTARRLRRLVRRSAKKIAEMQARVTQYQEHCGAERQARLEAICRGEHVENLGRFDIG